MSLCQHTVYIITYNSQTFFLPQGKKTLKLFIKIQFKPNKFLVNYVLERHFHSFQINIDKRWQLEFFVSISDKYTTWISRIITIWPADSSTQLEWNWTWRFGWICILFIVNSRWNSVLNWFSKWRCFEMA